MTNSSKMTIAELIEDLETTYKCVAPENDEFLNAIRLILKSHIPKRLDAECVTGEGAYAIYKYTCSNCGEEIDLGEVLIHRHYYCPACGRKHGATEPF